MAKFILGKKIEMTQVFEEDGRVTPVTLVEVEPNVVVQIKNKDKDGYEAVQVGTGSSKKLNKPEAGRVKNLDNVKNLREFRGATDLKVGDKLDASIFEPGDLVKVTNITKGKGFAGAVKRHGFSGMPSSHGHKHVKRHIGSIGQRFPQHTLKGKRMAGHMGSRTLTVRGLKVVRVDKDNGILAIKGSIPGNKGSLIKIITQ